MRQPMGYAKTTATLQLCQHNYHLSINKMILFVSIKLGIIISNVTVATAAPNQQSSILRGSIPHCSFPGNRTSHESTYFRVDFLPSQQDQPSPNNNRFGFCNEKKRHAAKKYLGQIVGSHSFASFMPLSFG